MNMIPFFLFLTCVGFLPTECEGLTLITSKGALNGHMRMVNEDPDWLANNPPNEFENYEVFVRTIDNIRYRCVQFIAANSTPEGEVPIEIALSLHRAQFKRLTGFMLYEPHMILRHDRDHVFIAIRMTKFVVYAEIDGGPTGRQLALNHRRYLDRSRNPNLQYLPIRN